MSGAGTRQTRYNLRRSALCGPSLLLCCRVLSLYLQFPERSDAGSGVIPAGLAPTAALIAALFWPQLPGGNMTFYLQQEGRPGLSFELRWPDRFWE